MKKTILSTLMLIAFATLTFAGGNKADKVLLSTMKDAYNSTSNLHWVHTSVTDKAVFSFNGKESAALYDATDNTFVGFSTHFTATELPQAVTDALNSKYAGWSVTDAEMLIDANAYVNYFVMITKGKNSITLKISPDGNTSIYSR